MAELDLDGPNDELIKVKRSVLRALNRDAKYWKGRAGHERTRREGWRRRALTAEALIKANAEEVEELRRCLYTAITGTEDSVEAWVVDHDTGMAWEIGDPHG